MNNVRESSSFVVIVKLCSIFGKIGSVLTTLPNLFKFNMHWYLCTWASAMIYFEVYLISLHCKELESTWNNVGKYTNK